MTPHEYIISSIWKFPTLYYYHTFEECRRAVLHHLFLVIGNGIVMYKDGSFGDDRGSEKIKRFSSREARILAGERIFVTYKSYKFDSFVGCDTYSEGKEAVYFEKDFNKTGLKMVEWLSDTPCPEFDIKTHRVVQVLPKGNDHLRMYKPYPFDLKYTPFWDRENKCFRKNVDPEWAKEIVWIYKLSLAWFSNDEEFYKDTYYNWADSLESIGGYFLTKWEKKKSVFDLCKDYKLKSFDYKTPREFAKAVVERDRAKRIRDCKKVIKFYSGLK